MDQAHVRRVGINVRDFRPEAATFEVYSEPQLRALAQQIGIEWADELYREDLQQRLAAAWPEGTYPPGFEQILVGSRDR